MVATLCWALPGSTLGGMARGSRGLQNDKRACPVPRVGEPLRDLNQQKGEPPGSGLWWYNTLVLCFASRLISVPYNCLTGGWSSWLESRQRQVHNTCIRAMDG